MWRTTLYRSGREIRAGETGGTSETVPTGPAPYTSRRHGPRMSFLRQASCLRTEPLALDGRHEAAVRRESPESSHLGSRRSPARVRLHALPQGGQDHQSLGAAPAQPGRDPTPPPSPPPPRGPPAAPPPP